MMRKLRVFIFLAVPGIFSLVPHALFAQTFSSRLVSDDGTTARIEFTADWSQGLKDTIDSSGISIWDSGTLNRFTDGVNEYSYQLGLGYTYSSDRPPVIQIIDREYEEVSVGMIPTSRKSASRPEVVAVGLGTYRKQKVVSISASFFSVNEAEGRIRRYTRFLVAVTSGAERNGARNNSLFRNSFTGSSNPHLLVSRSQLADGTLFKMSIIEEGVYRIDRAFIEAIGLDPDTTDPDALRIYGNGGAPLPALNSAFRYADVVESGIFRRGGGDGRFDEGDVILFYAAGPSGWEYRGSEWEHYVHPFSSENNYFLKAGVADASNIVSVPFPQYSNTAVFSNVQGRFFADFEEQLWSREHGSGHDWMSSTIRSGGVRTLLSDQALPGFAGGQLLYESRVAIASNPLATVAMASGGTVLAQFTAPFLTTRGSDKPTAAPGVFSFQQTLSAGQTVNLEMRLLQQINEPAAATDWVRILYDKALTSDGGKVRFSSIPETSGRQTYRLSGFSETPFVWDITDPANFRSLGTSISGNSVDIQVEIPLDSAPREFVAFTESAATPLSSTAVVPIPNQDLHGISSFPEFVIVTPGAFSDAATRLADRRRTEGMDVLVIVVDQIYNEFSGGVKDARAMRDYFKFLYDRAPDEASLLRYVLIFGDGHYDYRGLAGKQQDQNWILPYETEETLNTDASFTSDDYFGLLDDGEGVWPYDKFWTVSTERVDIGIGRLPANSPAMADLLIDKIFRYEDPATFGAWRSTYLAIADDGPTGLAGIQNDKDLHVQNIDQVAEFIRRSLYPELNVRKIYAESFERVFQNGFKIPDAKREINEAVNSGLLVFNYAGHGGPEGLAQEQIFTKEDAEALTNRDRLSIFITATCSFGWWDLDDTSSGAEELLYNPNGGAVALLTTVRLVYTSGDTTSLNAGLNRALNEELLTADADGRGRRLGDVMRLTKNTRVGLQGNSRKFNLLGDPTMRIGLPDQKVKVESLNGVPLETEEGQMKALDRVDIEGDVLRPDGSIDINFNGVATVTVFDAVRKVPLLEQLRMKTPYYLIREDLIWRGDVLIAEGHFKATYVVPKDISYSNEPGRIAVYASAADRAAMGYSQNFIVGGTSDSPPNDSDGPEITLFLNDTTFVTGGIVPSNPELIARFFDESGINTVGAGVGHEMLLVVDNDEQRAIDISSAFVSAPNSFQRGEARWRIELDSDGLHSLRVRSWDVLNNSSTAELAFSVVNDEVLELRNVYNYPNPMNRETQFVFEHNQPAGTPATVRIRIYSLSGRPIHTIDTDIALPEGILTGNLVQVHWDGLDDDFDRLATGIYLYTLRVEVEKPDGGRQVSEHIEKLAVIR